MQLNPAQVGQAAATTKKQSAYKLGGNVPGRAQTDARRPCYHMVCEV